MSAFQVFRNTLVVLVTLALAYLFLMTLNVWIVLVIAILVASALRRPIVRLRKWGIPQGIAILVVYGIMTLVTITLLVAVLPPVVNQFVGYIQDDNRLANRIIVAQSWVQQFISQSTGNDVQLGIDPDQIRTAVHDFVEHIRFTAPAFIGDISNFAGSLLLVIVMGIYWITSRERAEIFIIELLPLSKQAQAKVILDEVELGLGSYVQGVVTVAFSVGMLNFLVLSLLQVPGAATLSFVYAVATTIPIIGSFVGVVLTAGLAVLSASPATALIVMIVGIIIQQLETYILTPRIMSKNADFDEILVIVFIAAGFTLNGITGGLLAIPVAGTVAILLKHLVFEPRRARVAPEKVDGGLLLKPGDVEEPEISNNMSKNLKWDA